MTRERISFTFDPRDMFLQLKIDFSFVKAAVACTIVERTSGLEPLSETTALRYLSLYRTRFCPFYLNFPQDAIGTVCHQSGLLSTDLHLIPCAGSTPADFLCFGDATADLNFLLKDWF